MPYNTEITFEQFQKYVLKTDQMVDYKIPGIPIPSLSNYSFPYRTKPNGFEFYSPRNVSQIKTSYLVSHGWVEVNNEILIKIETKGYDYDLHYLVRESDLLSITSNQNKNQDTMQIQEITGYKLIKPEYEAAALKIVSQDSFTSFKNGVLFENDSINQRELATAGVLDLWFEPVFKAKEQTFNMGEFKLVVKDGKVFHNYDDITGFVIGLVNHYRAEHTFGGYNLKIEDVTFSKTGCQSSNTKLSDWIKVYEALNQK